MARSVGKITCDACPALDIQHWRRTGHLHTGTFIWRWSSASGQDIASVGVTVQQGTVSLTYRRNGQPVEQRIALTSTRLHYGGSRPWFLCPTCNRRAGKLYLAGHPLIFACRHCHDLAYATQHEGPRFRGLSRANRLRTKLGGTPGMVAPLPPKPKGMHQSTYARAIETIRTLEEKAERALA